MTSNLKRQTHTGASTPSIFSSRENNVAHPSPNLAEIKALLAELVEQYLANRAGPVTESYLKEKDDHYLKEKNEVYLKEKEVADRLNVSVKTIQAWRQSRLVDLPYCKFGNAVRYPLSKVIEFETNCRQTHQGQD